MSPGLIVLILSLLMGLQPVTTDLYLPALPGLAQDLGAAMTQAQLTLSALLLAFGLSQLIWGPLSDRFGRRPILLLGLAAYVLASIASTLAPSIGVLIACRIVQGAAMGAAIVCARAIVRDLYPPLAGAQVMSKSMTGLGVMACLSPPLGGLLSDLYNWRAALLVLAIFGAVCLGLVALRFTESLPTTRRQPLHPLMLARSWLGILRHPTFWTFSSLTSATYAGLFTFLASSSFVFIEVLGLGKTQYGLLMFSMAFAYILGTFLCRRLLSRFGVRRTVAVGGALSVTGGTLMGLLALAGWHNGWAIMLPFYLFMLGHGVHQPCGQSGAVGPFPQAAGAASALNGFAMMLVAFGVGSWLGGHMDGTVYPLALGVWFWSTLVAALAWTAVQKHGDPGGH